MFEFYLVVFWLQAFVIEHKNLLALIGLSPIFTGLLINGVSTLFGEPMPTEFLLPNEIWRAQSALWSKFNRLGKLVLGPIAVWAHVFFLLGAAPFAVIGHPFKVFKFLFLKRE